MALLLTRERFDKAGAHLRPDGSPAAAPRAGTASGRTPQGTQRERRLRAEHPRDSGHGKQPSGRAEHLGRG